MNCKKCNANLQSTDKFCSNCGTKVAPNIAEQLAEQIKEPVQKIERIKPENKNIICIVLITVGLVVALLGAIILSANISSYQEATKMLAEFQNKLNQFEGTLFYDMAKTYYQDSINQFQNNVNHYRGVLIISGVSAFFGVLLTVFSVLYMLLYKKDENTSGDEADGFNDIYFTPAFDEEPTFKTSFEEQSIDEFHKVKSLSKEDIDSNTDIDSHDVTNFHE